MKKTLLVTIDFWPKVGGVANYYFNLCQNLDKHKIVVLTQEDKVEEPADFKIYRKNLLTKLSIWPKWLPMFFYIYWAARKEKIEIIWVGEVLPTGTVVYFLAKFLPWPYIVSCHGNDLLQAKKAGRKKKLTERILKRAKYITVNSNYTKELVSSFGVSQDKIKIINPGI